MNTMSELEYRQMLEREQAGAARVNLWMGAEETVISGCTSKPSYEELEQKVAELEAKLKARTYPAS